MDLWRYIFSRDYERLPQAEQASGSGRDLQLEITSISDIETALISVHGMTCSACSTSVENAVRALPGVISAQVALLQHTAEVEYVGSKLSTKALLEAVEDAGFEAELLSDSRASAQPPQVLRLQVFGMSCSACSSAVEAVLQGLKGVRKAGVNLTQGEAEVEFDASKLQPDQIVAAVEGAGFEAKVTSQGGVEVARLTVTGMTCGSCASALERCLLAVPGVSQASVSYVTSLAEVWYNSSKTGPRNFIKAVDAAGFSASLCTDDCSGLGADAAQELAYWWRLFTTSLLFTVPVFFVAMICPMIPGSHHVLKAQLFGFPCDEVVKWALATPVQFVVGWRFQRGAWKALRRGTANMDVLVALGANASYGYSVISVMHHHFSRHHASGSYTPTDFFETCAMLITFILAGKYMECAVKRKTSEAITGLMQLAPDTALLVELDRNNRVRAQEQVPTALIHKGDFLKVLPGARIPADGDIVDGTTFINEAMITGEAVPVQKQPGDAIIGGTINTGGMIIMRATRVGSETVLSQIVRLVEHAQLAKAPIQAFADRIAAVFVPVVVAIAFATWLGWYVAGLSGVYPASWLPAGHTHFLFALLFGIAVLVIACPCALGLATPTAVMVGTGVAASLGILIKGGDALERAHKLTDVVFDKTGTLTRGRPTVTSCKIFDELVPLHAVCELAAAAEAASEHPLAIAVLDYAEQQLQRMELAARADVAACEGTAGGGRDKGEASSKGSIGGGWLKVSGMKVLPGMGITCWVPYKMAGVQPLQQQKQQKQQQQPDQGAPQQAQQPLGSPRGGGGGKPTDVRVTIGNRALAKQEGISVSSAMDAHMMEKEQQGCTCVILAVNHRAVAVLSVSDPLKAEAAGVVAALQQQGISCHLLTGDNERTARAVAAQLGLRSVRAEVLPAQKAEAVRALQAGGGIVAMVGDGINDSPALAAADVGVAIGSGTDIAVEAADYVLMRDNLEDVLAAVDLSRQTYRRIQLNYVWAMGYNALMIPIAAGVLYPALHLQLPPWIAGGCMVFSSISVVVSSLMLRRYQRPRPVLQALAVQ